MLIEMAELETLLEIQGIDLEILRAKKKRAELPQRIQVMKIRKKRDEIEPKRSQVLKLQEQTQAELTAVEDEDRGLKEKQERAQEAIDSSGADYRKVESHSKEMAGVAKRRVTLEEKLIELTAQMEKIAGVREQLESALEACDREEERLKESYQEEDAALVDKIRQLSSQRTEKADRLPGELVARYEKTASKCGGVGIGVLEGNSCGICRSSIDGGQLIDLKNQAPLGVCPSCKRLLVVSGDEAIE